MTIEEKAQIVSKIFAALDIVPKEQKDQLTGIIIGYSMASQFKETKGAQKWVGWIYHLWLTRVFMSQ